MTRAVVARARRHLLRRDPILAGVIRDVGPCRWGEAEPDLFAGLVQAIVSQQLSVKAAASIMRRIRCLLPDDRLDPSALSQTSTAALRKAGLSERKAGYIRDISARFIEGELQLDELGVLPDAEVIRLLTSLRGIGRWSAEMILIFRLNRPDVLPVDDVGLLRAVERTYNLRQRPSPQQLTDLSELWRPWRSIACWYLWASLDAL